MLEIFSTNKYDNEIALINGSKSITYKTLKNIIAGYIEILKDKKDNVIISTENNYYFIIQFFASVFSKKNIYLITDKTRLNTINIDYDILDCNLFSESKDYKFPEINPDNIIINFFTSGSSGKPKLIKKSLFNLISEGQDIGKEFNLKGQNLTVMSTTTMCHLFGLTFHLMVPICNRLKIITETVSYPESVNKKSNILVSTPTFLSSILKHNMQFEISPEYIISAGSKLKEEIFEILEKNSKIIEIYGSTETGVIAHKTLHNATFELFKNVNVKVHENNVEVISDYVFEKNITINDMVNVNNRQLTIQNRTDRLFKIYEKRVCADELENYLNKNKLIQSSYITKSGEKLVCLCTLSTEGQNFFLQNGITPTIKNLKKDLSQYSEIIPQRWKFIDVIPMNKMGKINKSLISHIFNVNLSLPLILGREIFANGIIYKIFFYKNCDFFKGHFQDFPLVPGLAQLYLAKEFANAYFELNLGQGQWKKIKFSNIIIPESIIYLKLEKTIKHVTYEYYDDNKKYASGIFLCENIFKGVQ